MNEATAAPTVEAEGLTRRFGARTAVDAVSLRLRRGEVLGFLGPNGAGKTTTMQMLTGNLAPSAGKVSICGIDLVEKPTMAKARIGYLPEAPPLYRELTVDEYLRLAGRLHRVPKKELPEAIERARQRTGLGDVAQRLIGTLSKGYQQRVGIAQAILHGPDVIILDEPTVGLDPNQIREIRLLIRELGRQHSVILSTHILPEVEQICDHVQIMHRGRMVFDDTIEALKRFRGGTDLMVGLRRPPSLTELRALAGIARAEQVAPTMFRLQPREGADPAETLVRASVAGDWGLYQLAPALTSLEDVFVQLTCSDEPAGDERGSR
jgi:ABC-2 type transport system ATP-binding protein